MNNMSPTHAFEAGMPMFSVVIPAYNAGSYIGRCLDSVKCQTFSSFECIVVNDGSSDDTMAQACSMVGCDRRFVLLDGPNGGVSSARNRGLDHARGEYVLFVDADDWVEPDWLQHLSQCCQGADIVQYDFYEADGTSRHEVHLDSDLGLILQGEGAVVWKRAYRRSFVADLRFDTSLKAGEDYLFSASLFLRSTKRDYTSRCLYNYNTANMQSAKHSAFAENFAHQLLATHAVEGLLKASGCYGEYQNDLRRRYYWCVREICWRWLSQNISSPFKRKSTLKMVNHLLKRGLR